MSLCMSHSTQNFSLKIREWPIQAVFTNNSSTYSSITNTYYYVTDYLLG